MSDVRIHLASLADVPALAALEQAANPMPWSANNLQDVVANTSGQYHVCMLQSWLGSEWQLLGYWVAMRGVDEAHLLNIAVHPQWQGQGCAHTLLMHLRVWALAQQAQSIWLEVRQSNVRAQHVYRQFGFTDVALRKNYYPLAEGGREHACIMQLVLSNHGDSV